jgi:hypothetical protein
VAVLATDPDTEDEPPRSQALDVRELAGHQDGMAQRQQVHAGVDRQRGMKRRQRGGLHEPVEPHAGEEAHVIAAADMVDARLGGLRQERPRGSWAMPEQVERRKHAHPRRSGRRLYRCRRARGRAGHWRAAHAAFSPWLGVLRWGRGQTAGISAGTRRW